MGTSFAPGFDDDVATTGTKKRTSQQATSLEDDGLIVPGSTWTPLPPPLPHVPNIGDGDRAATTGTIQPPPTGVPTDAPMFPGVPTDAPMFPAPPPPDAAPPDAFAPPPAPPTTAAPPMGAAPPDAFGPPPAPPPIGGATPDPIMPNAPKLTAGTPTQGIDTWTGKPMTATLKDGTVIQLDQNGGPIGDVPLDYYGPATHLYTEDSGGDPHGFAPGVSTFNTPGLSWDPKIMAAAQRAQVSGDVGAMKQVFESAGYTVGDNLFDLRSLPDGNLVPPPGFVPGAEYKTPLGKVVWDAQGKPALAMGAQEPGRVSYTNVDTTGKPISPANPELPAAPTTSTSTPLPGSGSAAGGRPGSTPTSALPTGSAPDARVGLPGGATPVRGSGYGGAMPATGGTSVAASGTPAAAGGTSRQQLIADLLTQYVTPGRQTTANNEDPLSAVTTIDPTNDLRSAVITNSDSARTADYANRVDQASRALPGDLAGRASTLTDQYLGQFGDLSTDVGKDYGGDLDNSDSLVSSLLGKVSGQDRQQLFDSLLAKYKGVLGPTDVQAGGAVNPTTSDRLAKLQALVDSSTNNVANVDRVALAKQMFDTMSVEGEPAYDLSIRKAKQAAAAAGGLWGGNLRTQYGDLAHARAQELDTLKSKLVQQALGDSVNDSFNKANLFSGLESQLSGEEAAQRGEQRTERGYQTDVSTGNVNRRLAAGVNAAQLAGTNADADLGTTRDALSAAMARSSDLSGRQQQRVVNQAGNVNRRLAATQSAQQSGATMAGNEAANSRANLGTLASLEANSRGNDTAATNALRGERTYQVGQEESAFERMLAQYQLEQQTKQQGFDNSLRLLGAGENGNPDNILASLANGMSGSLDPNTLAILAGSLGRGGSSGSTSGLSAADIQKIIDGKLDPTRAVA
jgi:hypothetical protein